MKSTWSSYRWLTLTAPLSLTLLLMACGSSTHFTSRWSAGDAQPVSANNMQIAAVFFDGNESIRRTGEDVIAREITRIGGTAVPSYRLVPEDPRDREMAKRKLEDAGIDAVLSMRVVTRERVGDYGPNYWTGSPYYGSLWGYWGHGWGAGYDVSDVIVGVETLLYSLRDDKLLWAGMSETLDPESIKDAVKSIARKAVDKMQEDNALTP
jgi:nitrogen regulatory protein PII-like uncharacterized protein